jgi:transposase-like protein
MKKLPDNNLLTQRFCTRFGEILVPDGKYVPIKGFNRDAVLLWGVDYWKHDFPLFFVGPSENYQSWEMYFRSLRNLNMHYKIVVCDDNRSLKQSCRRTFAKVHIQACYVHILRQIRLELRITKETTYREFYRLVQHALSIKVRHTVDYRQRLLGNLWKKALKKNEFEEMRILSWLDGHFGEELFSYQYLPRTPLTTNLIETFNSHLEGHIASLKGFETYEHAKLWFNAYVLKRRFMKFTDCTGKFRRLNGERPIDQTRNMSIAIQDVF